MNWSRATARIVLLPLTAVLALGVVLAPDGSVPPAPATARAVVGDEPQAHPRTRGGDDLAWGRCPRDARAPGVRCATLQVPLDHADPDGRQIEIAVSRLRSTDPDRRRGVLFTNTGGPGGPGLARPGELRDLIGMPASVFARYDVIGIDPRGVGRSAPVTCDFDVTRYANNLPLWADGPAQVRRDARRAERVAQKCARSETADIAPYITTANTARDLDLLRQALGEERISYFGVSYGTYLGAVYTSLFPEQGGRFLLDSSTGPGGWDATFQRRLSRGFEDRFPDFARYVADHPRLGLGRTPRQVRSTYDEIIRRLDRRPSPDGIDGRYFRQLTIDGMYYTVEFPVLAAQWRALDRGQALPSAREGRRGPAIGSVPVDNSVASNLHVLCNDNDWPERLSFYQRNVREDRRRFPLYGAAGANVSPCAYWPWEQLEPRVEIGDDGPRNLLILQNRRDPGTPLVGARAMRRALGDRARLLTVEAGGHLSYLYVGSRCADRAATLFLTRGRLGDKDGVCR